MNLCDLDHRSTAVGSNVWPKRKAAEANESRIAGLIFGSYLPKKVKQIENTCQKRE